jgi:hypothetical protein
LPVEVVVPLPIMDGEQVVVVLVDLEPINLVIQKQVVHSQ